MMKWMKDLAKKSPAKLKKLAAKIHKELKRVLVYLRINDEQNRISLTNVAMIVMLYKIGMTDATSITDLTALAIAVLGYQTKRVVEKKK